MSLVLLEKWISFAFVTSLGTLTYLHHKVRTIFGKDARNIDKPSPLVTFEFLKKHSHRLFARWQSLVGVTYQRYVASFRETRVVSIETRVLVIRPDMFVVFQDHLRQGGVVVSFEQRFSQFFFHKQGNELTRDDCKILPSGQFPCHVQVAMTLTLLV